MVGMNMPDGYKPSDETVAAFERRAEAAEKLAKFTSALMKTYDFDPYEMIGILDQQKMFIHEMMGIVGGGKGLGSLMAAMKAGDVVGFSSEELQKDPDAVLDKITDHLKKKLQDLMKEEGLD